MAIGKAPGILAVPEDNPKEREEYIAGALDEVESQLAAVALEVGATETVEVSSASMAMVGLEAKATTVTYNVVDLRGKIPGAAQPNQGSQKKYSGSVIHYNGDPSGYTGVASGRVSPVAVYAADARYHMQKNWGSASSPAWANGIQYHYGVWGKTLYILRNPLGILWHCGGWPWNASATAFNIPISNGERASRDTLLTLAGAVEKENRAQGLTHKNTYGHYEVGLPTQCPHSLMDDFVRPFRAGTLKVGPEAPALNLRKYNVVYPGSDHTKPDWIFNYFGKSKVLRAPNPKDSVPVADRCMSGELGANEVLVFADAMISNAAHDTLEPWGQKFGQSDVWDVRTEAKLQAAISEMGKREGKPNALKDYRRKFGTIPKAKARAFDVISGVPRYPEKQVHDWLGSRNASSACHALAEQIYLVAGMFPNAAPAPDFAAVQMAHETGFGAWSGGAKAYNPAGIKLANASGDAPGDFEKPKTAADGAHMLFNHWAALLAYDPVAPVHGRYAVAKAVYQSKGVYGKVTKIDQLGGGVWAADPQYASKLARYFNELEAGSDSSANAEKGLAYVRQIVGAPYGWWRSGPVSDNAPAWAKNDTPPDPAEVRRTSCMCSGVPNLMLREVGKKIPDSGAGPFWDGGAYAYGVVYDKPGISEPFDPAKIDTYPPGCLVGAHFINTKNQGDVCVTLGGGKAIASNATANGTTKPGVTTRMSLRELHRIFKYTYIVRPDKWIA